MPAYEFVSEILRPYMADSAKDKKPRNPIAVYFELTD